MWRKWIAMLAALALVWSLSVPALAEEADGPDGAAGYVSPEEDPSPEKAAPPETAEQAEENAEPTEEPADPAEESGGQTEETAAPTVEPLDTTEEPADTTEENADADIAPSEESAAPAEEDAAPEEEAIATGTFRDVPDKSWYKDIVERAYAAGIVAGITEDTFGPAEIASRGQTVAMLWRQAGSPSGSGRMFTDLTAGYYKSAVDWASYVQVVKGATATSFAPNSPITREQLVSVLYRMAGSPASGAGSLAAGWADGGAVSAYAQPAMGWALGCGIITGYEDGTLRPQAAATRAEVCAMLLRYGELVGRYPTQPPAPAFQETALRQNVSHSGRNTDNPRLIQPKRKKMDKGLYDSGKDHDKFMQQWAETFWDLDRSGEDVMWCCQWETRMRSGPGTGYEVVYTIGNAYEVSRLGPDENGWTPVVYHEYETATGFTGWDHTGYVPTACLTKTAPRSPQVADFSSGKALDAWCENCGYQTGEFLHETGGKFYHEAYDPSVSGDTYTYTLRDGGQVTLRDVDPRGLVSVEVSAYEKDVTLTVFVYVAFGYGIKCPGYNGGYGLSPSGDGLSCGLYYSLELAPGESVDMTMVSGDEAPRVLQVTLKDTLGGSRGGSGTSRFVFLDKNGSLAAYNARENFFNLKSGYKLKSLSPYASVGKVENNELHYFDVKKLPKDVDEIWFQVVR